MRQQGKTAALQAAVEAWLTLYGHDSTRVAWLAGPDGITRWDVATQRWVPVPPPEGRDGSSQ
jgi:hypothetical protein